MNRGTTIFGVILAFGVGFFIGHYTANGRATGSSAGGMELSTQPYVGANVPAAPAGERFKVFPGNAPFKGAKNPKVVIIEYSDFQCPFCSRGHDTIEQVLQAFPDVRFYYKENPLPFHQNAKPAAEAAMAALQQGPEFFWKLYDKMFTNQKDLSKENISKWAQETGLNMEKFNAALANPKPLDDQIEADQKEAASWGLQGTPMFLVDGRPIRGAQPFDQFKKVVDEEMAAASKDLSAGVPPNQLYATLLANATATPPQQPQQQPQRPQVAQADPNQLYNVPIAGAPVRGSKNPKVVIVEWSDFQCPFCKRVEPTLADLMKQDPDVAVVWHNFPLPFHPNAMPDAEAAMAAKAQGKFWEFHDMLYDHQDTQDRAHFEQWAQQLGLNMAQFKADLDSHKYQAEIRTDQQLGQKFGVNGTPAFFIDGKFLSGAQPIDAFKTIVDAQMKLADAALARGVKHEELYAELVKSGLDHASIPNAPAPSAAPGQPDANAVYKVALGDAPVRGPKNAKVTIVLFSDFQCPFCGRVEPTLKAILDKYPQDVRVAWKNFPLPFHPNAMPAAEVASEAKAEGKFWPVHDALFAGQANLDRDHLLQIAQANGLNMDKVKAALDSNTYKAEIDRDAAQGKTFGVSGTPSMFINGKFVVGALPVEQMQPKIDQALAEANAAIKGGAPAGDVYDAIIKNGKDSVPAGGAAPGGAEPAPGSQVYKVDAGTSYALGPATAPVTIVEFSDFQCPFCKRVEPTVKQILSTYGPKVRLVWKNYPLPFHQNAMPAAEAAMAAGSQGKFWQFHDLLFENQETMDRQHFDQWAQQLGLNVPAFNSALDGHRFASAVTSDKQYGDSITQMGTPTFYINGRQIVGAQDFSAFQQVINDELKKKGLM